MAFFLQLEDVMRKYFTDEQSAETDTFLKEQYLTILLKCNHHDRALETANQILQCDASNLRSLETVCICYAEGNAAISLEAAGEAVNFLLAINAESQHAILANAQLLLNRGSALDAKHLLENYVAKEKNVLTANLLLCDAYKQLQQWNQVEKMCRCLLISCSATEWKARLIESLLEQASAEQLDESRQLLVDINSCDLRFKLLKALHQLRCNDLETPRWILTFDEEMPSPDLAVKVISLKAELLDKSHRREEAIALLELAKKNHPNSVILLLQCAKQYWHSQQAAKSVCDFLSVIKLNKDIAEPYVYLGTFYAAQSDNSSALRRATQCLEKAFQLDPTQTATAQQLVELYRQSHNLAAALKLLDSVILLDPLHCQWAWSLKGHCHLKMLQKSSSPQEKTQAATLAIASFQKALRSNMDDNASWEALGDAYMARGSYMSALKAFQKAVQLNAQSIYSIYQIAAIKQLLGEYRQAVEAYENLLVHTPDYLPALKGVAHTTSIILH